jgi:NADH-quinone oxidoreductase subunit C
MSTLTDHGDAAAAAKVHARFPDCTAAPVEFRGDWRVQVEPLREAEVVAWAREELGFEFFLDRLGADRGEESEPRFDVITIVCHPATGRRVHFVTTASGVDPVVPTLTGVFRGANWFEREVYDMFGVRFEGHPDMKRILMADSFPAHDFPLRKDYPVEGRGAFAAPRRALGGNVDGTDGEVAVPAHPGEPGPPTRDPLEPRT